MRAWWWTTTGHNAARAARTGERRTSLEVEPTSPSHLSAGLGWTGLQRRVQGGDPGVRGTVTSGIRMDPRCQRLGRPY